MVMRAGAEAIEAIACSSFIRLLARSRTHRPAVLLPCACVLAWLTKRHGVHFGGVCQCGARRYSLGRLRWHHCGVGVGALAC